MHWRGYRSWAVPSAILLIAAALIGQLWRDRPAGAATAVLVAHIARSCASAAGGMKEPTAVRDGARAIDRWMWRRVEALIRADWPCRSDGREGAFIRSRSGWQSQPKRRSIGVDHRKRQRGMKKGSLSSEAR
jgi:hypothetical protein